MGLRTALEALGAEIEMESDEQEIVQASVPYGVLEALSNVNGVRLITEPSYGVVNVGTNLTEGDAILNYDDVRSLQGVDGTGVTVGVISTGIFGLADAVAAGDLPATTETRTGGILTATSGGVIATSFRADGDLEMWISSPDGEGTAMLEIVHDIAPGAQLRFANFSTSLEFMAAVDFLASVSDVVVDDIGWLARPTDGTSDVSTNTANALTNTGNPIRSYVTSVGNSALEHYESMYVDSGIDGAPFVGLSGSFHQFASIGGSTDCLGLGLSPANPIFLAPGQTSTITLTWDEPFGSATSDYNLLMRQNPSGPVVASSLMDNPNFTGDPMEWLSFTNLNASSTFYDVFVQNANNSAPARNLEMFFSGGIPFPCTGTAANYNTVGGSAGAQSDAGGGVISVGAIRSTDSGHDTIESFSSQGPTGDGRMKPDITGIDGVDVSGAGGFSDPFFGTSASAPHIAGLAALLLEFRPDLKAGDAGDDPTTDRATLRNAILNGGVDLGATGPDQVFGYGRANGVASAAELFAAPVFDAHAGVFGVEGTALVLTDLTFSDLNTSDTHSATVSWGNTQVSTGSVDQGLRIVSATHVYDDDSSAYSINATVTDDDGVQGFLQFYANISNASPVVDAGAPLVVIEGATLTYDASFTDPGTADTHTALVDWGDATVASATVDQGPGTTSATRTFDDDAGPFTLTLTVTDDDGGVGVDTTTITVLNATPVVDAASNLLVNASDVIDTQIATFSDAGVLDTHTATVDWGDGTALATGTVDQGAGTVDGSHIYDVQGTYTVTVTVTDDDGGVDSATFEVVVVEDTPVVDAGVDLSVEEGSSLLLSFSFVDAASETHDATVVWGDGATTTATVNQSLDTGSATHTYDDQGVFIAQASVSDDTGKSGLDTLTITVSNATPVVVAGANLVVGVSTVSDEVLATFTDAGVLDTHTAMIDWGDGTPLATGTVDAGSVRGSHSYGFYGLYTVTVTVTDNDGGSGSTTLSAQVYNIPAVPSITAWGMALSAVLLAMVYWWAMRRRPLIQARRQ